MPSTEDHTLNEAIQASLQDFKEDTDMSPLKNSVREGNRYVVQQSRFSVFPDLVILAPLLFALKYLLLHTLVW